MKKIFIFLLFLSLKSFSQSTCIGTAGQVKWSYWTDFQVTPDTAGLFASENFPHNPAATLTLSSLSSPPNYTDYYGGMMRGFLKAPITGAYTFNVTADDKAYFYLSTTNNPANKVLRSFVTSYTAYLGHDAYPSQTSVSVNLVAGQYYYFELFNFEGYGGDHGFLYWKKPGDTAWGTIDYTNLSEYACEPVRCIAAGTPCDDNNSLTTDDKQDGNCNCVGKTPTSNACIGDRAKVEAYYFDNIPGGYVENDLISAPKFPLLPDRRELLKGLYGPLKFYENNDYGSLVQGFITVPVTGNYEFNLTGDNQTFFYLSSNDSVQYKQNHQMVVLFGIGEYEHTNSSLQNSGPVMLEKGKYYYYEIRHKESGWRDHFQLFWKTPYQASPKKWKKIPGIHLYDYKCELSCIAQNTLCDDGNAFTNNDKIDANCNCVGTPCSGPDCDDPGARYKVYDDCAPTNNLSTLQEAMWESCTPLASPNTARTGTSHWIKYSFDDIYKFGGTRVWNYNAVGQANKGFRQVEVDYSMDGTSWTKLGGTYTWPIAPGTTSTVADYAGFLGPNFNNIKAKHILITALNNHGSTACSGISKLSIDAIICNPKDSPCDDADPLTIYDKFDDNCNCKGIKIACASDTLLLGKYNLSSSSFQAVKRINSSSSVPLTENISFSAGNSIVLLPGFEVKTNAVFKAEIKNCIQQTFAANVLESSERNARKSKMINESEESEQIKKVIFKLNEAGKVKLSVKDNNGAELAVLIDGYQENLGTQTKLIPTQKLANGTYIIELIINDNVVSEVFEVKR